MAHIDRLNSAQVKAFIRGIWAERVSFALISANGDPMQKSERHHRLNQWRGLATRYEKRVANFRAMAVIASIVVWLGS